MRVKRCKIFEIAKVNSYRTLTFGIETSKVLTQILLISLSSLCRSSLSNAVQI